jgi:hypothetical protein
MTPEFLYLAVSRCPPQLCNSPPCPQVRYYSEYYDNCFFFCKLFEFTMKATYCLVFLAFGFYRTVLTQCDIFLSLTFYLTYSFKLLLLINVTVILFHCHGVNMSQFIYSL